MSDTEALVLEIADKHDHITCLRDKIRNLEDRAEGLERKVQFREKIIRELRRAKHQQQVVVRASSKSLVSVRKTFSPISLTHSLTQLIHLLKRA